MGSPHLAEEICTQPGHSMDQEVAGPSPIAPRPRLCCLYRRSDYDGYGFNLYKLRQVEGQYVGKIEAGSPAERGGLQNGDRVVEVNGENVENKSHKKVVRKIRDLKNEVSLLVVDKACDEHFKLGKLQVSSKTPDVVIIHSNVVKEEDRSSLQSSDSSVIDETLFEQDDKRQNDEDNTANKVEEIHEESDSDDGHSPADYQTLETEQTSAATDDVAMSTGGSDDDKQIIAAMKE